MFTLRILLINTFTGKIRRCRLVNWLEKVGFKKIQKLLEIFERERHHEILLMVKNLRKLSRNPSSYILPVIPRPLPAEVVESEHYLLTLVPGSLSLAHTSEAEVVGRELAISFQSKQPSLAKEDPGVASRVSEKVDRGSRLKKRVPVLPPKHPRREGGCLNNGECLVRGWKILSPGLF